MKGKKIEFLKKTIKNIVFACLIIMLTIACIFILFIFLQKLLDTTINNPLSILYILILIVIFGAIKFSFEDVYHISLSDYLKKKFHKKENKGKNERFKKTSAKSRNT